MMTLEEKMGLQTLVIDEIYQRQKEQPTLLIDALLADQGRALLHHILSRRNSMAVQAAQMTAQLLRAFQTDGLQPLTNSEDAA